MTFKELELFFYLCENTHISQLAKKISLSQSAISLAIKSLENKLGEPLFDRIGKKLILNERGRLFKEKTYHNFFALKDAGTFFKSDKLSGILHIASSKTIGDFIMPTIVFDFLGEYPNVKIDKSINNSSEIIEKIKNGSLDIGFIEVDSHDENIIQEYIKSDEMVIVTSDKTLPKEVYLDELNTKKWILREEGSGTRTEFLKGIGSLSNELNIFMEYRDFQEVKNLLKNNPEAITCISKISVKQELEQGELVEVKLKNITIKREFNCIYHTHKYKSKLLDEFKRFTIENF